MAVGVAGAGDRDSEARSKGKKVAPKKRAKKKCSRKR